MRRIAVVVLGPRDHPWHGGGRRRRGTACGRHGCRCRRADQPGRRASVVHLFRLLLQLHDRFARDAGGDVERPGWRVRGLAGRVRGRRAHVHGCHGCRQDDLRPLLAGPRCFTDLQIGGGGVVVAPPGTPCGRRCQMYPLGTAPHVHATPAAGSVFSAGTGCCTTITTANGACRRSANAGPHAGVWIARPTLLGCRQQGSSAGVENHDLHGRGPNT